MIAYQVYSAREEAAKDLEAVFATLHQLGYEGVEFAGFYGHEAQEVKALLEKYSLKPVSSHVALNLLKEDIEGQIAYHKAIGCDTMAVPYLPEELRPGKPGFATTVADIYALAQKVNQAGMTLLYHNHDFEFVPFSGMYALDFLYEAIPALKTELDVCWVKFAGEDPVKYVKKYAGRSHILHLKDYVGAKDGGTPYGLLGQSDKGDAQAFCFKPVGYGCQDFAPIVEAALQSGIDCFIVEQDLSPERPPLEAAKMSIDTLRKLGL